MPGSEAIAAPAGLPHNARKEAKRRTRQKLLAAARSIVISEGESQLSAVAVARAAGVGGATFYEHFENKDALLRSLASELFDELRTGLREPRRAAVRSPNNEDKLREQFRRPLELLVENAALFRLALRERHSPRSLLGDRSRQLGRNTRTDLVEELIDRGYPRETAADLRRLEMIADVHIAATEALALGHLAGRYPDLDEIVDMLILVTRGTRLVRTRR